MMKKMQLLFLATDTCDGFSVSKSIMCTVYLSYIESLLPFFFLTIYLLAPLLSCRGMKKKKKALRRKQKDQTSAQWKEKCLAVSFFWLKCHKSPGSEVPLQQPFETHRRQRLTFTNWEGGECFHPTLKNNSSHLTQISHITITTTFSIALRNQRRTLNGRSSLDFPSPDRQPCWN